MLFQLYLKDSHADRSEAGQRTHSQLWDELVPYLGTQQYLWISLGGGPRQHHHLASCTPLESLEKWNRMLLPISTEVWIMWLCNCLRK